MSRLNQVNKDGDNVGLCYWSN